MLFAWLAKQLFENLSGNVIAGDGCTTLGGVGWGLYFSVIFDQFFFLLDFGKEIFIISRGIQYNSNQ